MMPDRTTLLIACAIAATSLARLSPAIHEMLGFLYAVHALRSHRRDLRRVVSGSGLSGGADTVCLHRETRSLASPR